MRCGRPVRQGQADHLRGGDGGGADLHRRHGSAPVYADGGWVTEQHGRLGEADRSDPPGGRQEELAGAADVLGDQYLPDPGAPAAERGPWTAPSTSPGGAAAPLAACPFTLAAGLSVATPRPSAAAMLSPEWPS